MVLKHQSSEGQKGRRCFLLSTVMVIGFNTVPNQICRGSIRACDWTVQPLNNFCESCKEGQKIDTAHPSSQYVRGAGCTVPCDPTATDPAWRLLLQAEGNSVAYGARTTTTKSRGAKTTAVLRGSSFLASSLQALSSWAVLELSCDHTPPFQPAPDGPRCFLSTLFCHRCGNEREKRVKNLKKSNSRQSLD